MLQWLRAKTPETPERSFARKTPVYDHSGGLLYQADRTRALELVARHDVDILGTYPRVRALRFQGPDPALSMGGSHHKRGLGTPHRNESYYNVRGCWHLDVIPEKYRSYFVQVLESTVRT